MHFAKGAPDLIHALTHLVRSADPHHQTVITTHFREIFDLDLLQLPKISAAGSERPLKPVASSIKFFQMDVIVDKQVCPTQSGAPTELTGAERYEPEYTELITPLFRLVPGRAAKSYGVACARMAGVPEGVLVRASAVSAALEAGSPVPLPTLSSESLTSFRRAFTVMESQAFCADAIMSIVDWRTADPSQLRLLLQFFVAST